MVLGIIVKIPTNLFLSKCKCKAGEYEATSDDVIQDVTIWEKRKNQIKYIQIFFLRFRECFLGIIVKIPTNLFLSKYKCKVEEYEATSDDVIQDVAIWEKRNNLV